MPLILIKGTNKEGVKNFFFFFFNVFSFLSFGLSFSSFCTLYEKKYKLVYSLPRPVFFSLFTIKFTPLMRKDTMRNRFWNETIWIRTTCRLLLWSFFVAFFRSNAQKRKTTGDDEKSVVIQKKRAYELVRNNPNM